MSVEVRPIVCDHAIYNDDKLALILNSKRNAELIKAIVDKDALGNHIGGPHCWFTIADFYEFEDGHPLDGGKETEK